MSLDNMTEKTFLQKIRDATFSKLTNIALLSVLAVGCGKKPCDTNRDCEPLHQICVENYCEFECVSDNDCSKVDDICHNNKCIPPDWKYGYKNTEVNGMVFWSRKTNQKGYTSFNQLYSTNSKLQIQVVDTNGNPLSNANVTLGEGYSQFSTILLEKEGHHVVFQTFPHLLDMVPDTKTDSVEDFVKLFFSVNRSNDTSLTIWDKAHEANPQKINAMEGYLEWSNKSYTYSKCMTKEQLKQSRLYSSILITFLSGWAVIGGAYEGLIKLEDWGLINTLPSDLYQIYEPSNFTAPAKIVGTEIVPEICYDSVDNDCDGLIDKKDPDCISTQDNCVDLCSPAGATRCNVSTSAQTCGDYWGKSCLEWETTEWCEKDEECVDGKCVSKYPECYDSCYDKGNIECLDNSVKECATNDKGCLEYQIIEKCGNDETCVGSKCEPTTSTSCKNECAYDGQKMCENSWERKVCGDIDSDPCLEWKIESCGSGEKCNSGECKTSTTSCVDECSTWACESSFILTKCQDYNNDGCKEKKTETCPSGTACEDKGLSATCYAIKCATDNDCNGGICKTDYKECYPQPESLCSSSCIYISISVSDNGSSKDDSFGLDVAGSFYGETPIGGSKTWNMAIVPNKTYSVTLSGVGVPDGDGTYSISFSNNVTAFGGGPLTGQGLKQGSSKIWKITAK